MWLWEARRLSLKIVLVDVLDGVRSMGTTILTGGLLSLICELFFDFEL